MRTFLSKVPVLALIALAACGQPHSDKRVIVFGVDGMDPEMLQERIDRGMMPNFKALLADGGCTFNGQPQLSLQTSWPPQSPVAWSNFITGVNPGKHGLYDFIHVDRSNYGIVSSMSETTLFPRCLRLPTSAAKCICLAIPCHFRVVSKR